MRFLDPACGCGNFLVLGYRELRLLELEVLRELNAYGMQISALSVLILVDVDQFFGIELAECPVRIAEVAMWLRDGGRKWPIQGLGNIFQKQGAKSVVVTLWKVQMPEQRFSWKSSIKGEGRSVGLPKPKRYNRRNWPSFKVKQGQTTRSLTLSTRTTGRRLC
jgi:restriction-modification enzyme MmeI-like protein